MAAVDRNTGKPATQANTTDFTQLQTQGPQTQVTNTTGTQQTTGGTTGVSANYTLNTTPEARAALNSLIQELSDRPVIDQSAAEAKFPTVKGQFDPHAGWYYKNPVTGLTMTAQEAQAFNTQQQAKQQEYIKSGGMIAGGTIEQQVQNKERQTEIARNREQQGKYSKEAAFADTKMLSDYFTRVLSEQQLPAILRGAEGSGASQGTTRALLMNDAIARSAETAAKVGIEAAGTYGGISGQLASVLEAETRSDPNGVAAKLLEALNVSKGIESSGTTVQAQQTNQKTNTTQQTVTTKGADISTVSRNYQTPPIDNPPAEQSQAYTPSANAGTGYIVANAPEPYKDVGFVKYGGNDSDVTIED